MTRALADTSSPTLQRGPAFLHAKLALFIGFAFAVMADPVSSVAYAIEAATRALGNNLSLLFPTMLVVIGIIALVIANYHQLVAIFPEGGGSAAAAGTAFGEGWAFIPLGALVVDFVLTIAVSIAAAASAIIAYFPSIAPLRMPIVLALAVLVAGLTWFGHWGRLVFALMTLTFIAVAVVMIGSGYLHPPVPGAVPPLTPAGHRSAIFAVCLAFPVAMALATGVEAPSSAIAQLAQLDDRGRRRFGRLTLWLTLAIVGTVTLTITWLAVRLHIGIPPADSTQIADAAKAVSGRAVFAIFQATSALLLLAAASSSFQAGPGLLKALARSDGGGRHGLGILPAWMGRTNAHHTPYWSVVLYLGVAAAVIAAAGGRDQELVLFYAVSVFMSFLAGLLAMLKFSHHQHKRGALLLNALGTLLVGFTLLVNLLRGYPLVSLFAALLIAFTFHRLWVRAGRPRGVSFADRMAEAELAEGGSATGAEGPGTGDDD
jgi:amino acid transporter